MPIDKTKITKEIVAKAAECKTADQLVALAKDNGVTLTKAEAEAYLAELENMELDIADLDKVAAGSRVCYAVDNCASKMMKNDCVHMF